MPSTCLTASPPAKGCCVSTTWTRVLVCPYQRAPLLLSKLCARRLIPRPAIPWTASGTLRTGRGLITTAYPCCCRGMSNTSSSSNHATTPPFSPKSSVSSTSHDCMNCTMPLAILCTATTRQRQLSRLEPSQAPVRFCGDGQWIW